MTIALNAIMMSLSHVEIGTHENEHKYHGYNFAVSLFTKRFYYTQRHFIAKFNKNLIVTDVKLSKCNFYFYCRLLHKISVVHSKFRNDTANILCSVLNSRLLKPTILKFSFMFIEFRYNLSFRVLLIHNGEFSITEVKFT